MPYQILLIDDDRAFREEFRDFFDDYSVLEASDGKEAIGILKKPNEIDLVVLDVMMPGARGTEVLKEIKKMDPSLGIIILTGYSTKDVAVAALRGRADDYLEKPLDVARAKATIESVLKKKETGGGDTGRAAVSKIDRVKRFAERNFHKRICLHDAAHAVCLSPKYLSRVFMLSEGITFSEYRLRVKMEKAKALLAAPGHNVNEVADMLGYENPESFIRQFKKFARVTPAGYRKKARILEARAKVNKPRKARKGHGRRKRGGGKKS